MRVRMIGGLYAGEVRNLPFIAARGAIRSGQAVAVEEEAATTARPIDEEPVPAVVTPPPMVHRQDHHKRPGRRR
jgi:hypothetical protein